MPVTPPILYRDVSWIIPPCSSTPKNLKCEYVEEYEAVVHRFAAGTYVCACGEIDLTYRRDEKYRLTKTANSRMKGAK